MYVKSLRLAGFKSFADPTILEFDRGVNVIVGPNGSGKSNISDALAWVLGSQAPSSLRGASMEDVIFAGSSSRPRLGQAEVVLTLDNSDRILPLDLSEVTITRLNDRAGTSEYRLNGASCRLLDIAELLSDAGIGRSIHTIVGQGQLDAVLQAGPEERRVFIEEAAQIGKFRRRKDRSVRKIERVDDNLTRLGDVLSELRRSLRPLRRQASAAAMYSELVGEHHTLRQRLMATEVARLRSEDARVDPERDAHRAALLSDELRSVRARLETGSGERMDLSAAAEDAARIAGQMGRAVDRLGSLRRLATERAEKITARLAAETEEGYRERIKLLDAQRIRWGQETSALASTAETRRDRAADALSALKEARSEREEAERALARMRAEETAAAQALVRAEGGEAAGRATLGSIEARVRAVEERREVAENALRDASASVGAAEKEVRELESELDSKTEEAARAELVMEERRGRAEELKSRFGTSHAHRAAAAARAGALEEVAGLFVDRPDVVERIAPLLAEARRLEALAEADEDEARTVLAAADSAVDDAWERVADLDDQLRKLDAMFSGAAERLAGARRRRENREIELAALDEELARTRESLASAQRAAAEERAALPAHVAALEEAREARAEVENRLLGARAGEQELAAASTNAEMEARSAEEQMLAARLRREEAETGIADTERALAGLEGLRAALKDARRKALEVARVAAIASERGAGWVGRAEQSALEARSRADEGERRLDELRRRERELATGLEEAARRRNEAEVRRAENRARIEAVAERSMDEWGMDIDALGALEVLDDAAEAAARRRVQGLDRDMKRLGPVNPRAAEEYAELAERENFLLAQIEDLKSSRRDLMKVVTEIDGTILELFSQAFEDVAREFADVFDRLFPGGSGRLVATDPDDLLASGIEIEARPPGKNVRKLSLLSGGERSLVALAFLFAIFRSRPSPFYLLDEVEAALDDVNLSRFLRLIDELEERAQVLVVTHQKRTMEAADVLYGVSMAKDGVSRVVARRLEDVAS